MIERNHKRYITRLHLKSYGLSDYQIRVLLKDVETRYNVQSHLKEYLVHDIQKNVKKRLTNPRIRKETRCCLDLVLQLLSHQSKVVEVDFLRQLSPEKRLQFFYNRLEEIDREEANLRQSTESVLTKARQAIGMHV